MCDLHLNGFVNLDDGFTREDFKLKAFELWTEWNQIWQIIGWDIDSCSLGELLKIPVTDIIT